MSSASPGLADVTGQDVIGIPLVMAVRPGEPIPGCEAGGAGPVVRKPPDHWT